MTDFPKKRAPGLQSSKDYTGLMLKIQNVQNLLARILL